MITEEIINDAYIRSIVNRDRKIIYRTQAQVVRANFIDTGTLARYLVSKPFSEQGTTFWFRVLSYLRFLDIKYASRQKRRSLALYNRVIWGVLYGETLPDIQYGFTSDIKEKIRAQLMREDALRRSAE